MNGSNMDKTKFICVVEEKSQVLMTLTKMALENVSRKGAKCC